MPSAPAGPQDSGASPPIPRSPRTRAKLARKRMLEYQLNRKAGIVTGGIAFSLGQGHTDTMAALLEDSGKKSHAEWQRHAHRQLNRVSRNYWQQHLALFWCIVISVSLIVMFRVSLVNWDLGDVSQRGGGNETACY
mmetsp:Transcript_58853/g.187982  ORF Transcript_58853/g.187982 Transcript_58853/m.187982 type:complete len:136 (-) Transcript_58853:2968-3375(-)